MPLTLTDGAVTHWDIRKIGVVGPGIVGMPMAALLAHSRVAKVLVVQRDSPTSGWKVRAINEGRSPIGGVEPDLDRIVAGAVAAGYLSASHDPADLADADVVLVCVQTDRKGFGPDYGPMFEALHGVAEALARRPAGNVPLVVFESTLAPSSMATVIRNLFQSHGLVEGRDVLLGNSPNRVMPGRLVERVAGSDKVVAGLHPATPELVRRLYSRIVTKGTLHPTNSLTAEVEKTLENAYRDVRIAFSAEVCRWCDSRNIDFFALRDAVNVRLEQQDGASSDPTAVPTGGLLVPMVGVGGHCLPKDGILLWWRALEGGLDASRSLILESRRINDASPAGTLALAERAFGPLDGKGVALLGAAYRGDSEDTRNSPSLALALLLLDRGCDVALHDPYVRPGDQNLVRRGLDERFTTDLEAALRGRDTWFACTPHAVYTGALLPGRAGPGTRFVDGCNLLRAADFAPGSYAGIGRGTRTPEPGLADCVAAWFRALERGFSREILGLCDFLGDRYASGPRGRVDFDRLRAIAETCSTGCRLVEPERPDPVTPWDGFLPVLAGMAR
jgi:UDP-N-acetyl-D-mannosaminuronic acid dehydrogenase